jgi:hypothetical protein
MFNKAKIALSITIALNAASGAFAAPKHPVHQHRAVVTREPSGTRAYGYSSFGHAYPPSVIEALKREAAGDSRCRGGNCDPASGSGLADTN